MRAALAVDDAGVTQATDDLLQLGAWKILLLGDIGQGDGLAVIHAGEGHHEAHPVLAARAERDGTAAVQSAGAGFLVVVHWAS